MRLSTEAQEALEVLWEHHERDDVTPSDLPELAGAVNELTDADLVTARNGSVELTETGLAEARQAIRRHRLAERLLADVLSVSRADLEAASCEFEHVLHAGIEDRVCALLGHPVRCPHGHPIPRGTCCEAASEASSRLVARLTGMAAGTEGTLAYLSSDDPALLRELANMGLLPGVRLRLDRKAPAFVVTHGESQFAIDTEMADAIFVRPD